jgi:parallel beta-helix repeat protein
MNRRSAIRLFPLLGLLVVTLLASRPAAAATPIDHCPYTITSPGDYVVTQDLRGCSGTAIEIQASNVHLSLGGHTVSGVLTGSSFVGIAVGGGQSGVTITGPGTIAGFQRGVLVAGDDNTVQHLVLSHNAFGIEVIGTHHNNSIEHNDASNNATLGIIIEGTANLIQQNTAIGNGIVDLFDGNANCDANVWQHNKFVTANQSSCIH